MAIQSLRKGGLATVLALATPMVAQFEGLRLKAYLDVAGVPTICYGETEGVQLGQARSAEECAEMLSFRVGYYSYRVWSMTGSLPPETHAALTSFAYNVGLGAFEKSTLLRKLKAGDGEGACRELPRWVYSNGKKYAGLVTRREAEMTLCLKGVLHADLQPQGDDGHSRAMGRDAGDGGENTQLGFAERNSYPT